MKLRWNPAFKYALGLSVLLTLLRFFIAANTGLGVGESYYARGVLDLQLSYFDQPPLFFWLSSLSCKCFGFTPFGLRFPAVVLFFGTSMLLYATAKHFYNEWTGFFSVLLISSSFVFTLPVATWFQPDALLMFFWMLCIYLFAKIFFPKNDGTGTTNSYLNWLLLGLSIGLASLSKYHSVFLFFGAFMFILLNKKQRYWLRHPAPYLALLLHFLILTPVFIWNAQHEWISFAFQGSRAGAGNGFEIHFDWFLRSVVGQSIWLLPWIWFWLIQQLIRSSRKGFVNRKQSFFLWMSVSPILFFTLITLWADTQYHFHWQAPGYMVLFIPLANHFYTRNKENKINAKRKLWTSFVVCAGLATFLALHMVTGFWQKWGPGQITRETGGSYDPTIEGIDFDEVAHRFKQEGWLGDENIFVATANWWQTGKIDWPLRCQKPVVIFSTDPRNYAYFGEARKNKGKDAIFVRFQSETAPGELYPYFDEVTRVESIAIMRGKVQELTLDVFYCRNFHPPAIPNTDRVLDRQLMGLSPFK